MALNMDKAALKKFLGSMFVTLKTLNIETMSVSGHKKFTAWEWQMHFTKAEDVSDFEDINAKESKEGEVLTMLGVSVRLLKIMIMRVCLRVQRRIVVSDAVRCG
jgi:hypothetical protein